ncbi:MAG: L-histidine N(alpha)-methyltransferase [Rickettsiales bacterium]
MLAVRNWLHKIPMPVWGNSDPYFILSHTDKILHDFTSLLSGTNSHNLTPYIYLNEDNAYEDLITKCRPYYLCREEAKVIKENLPKISKDLADTDILVELGPGSKSSFNKKTLPILESLPSLKKYISVDICKESAKTAAKLASQSKNAPFCSYVVESFNSFKTLKSANKKHTFVFFGSTLGNFSEDEMNGLLQNVSKNMNVGDKILITLDTNQDYSSIKQAYNNKYIKSLFLNSLIVVSEKLNLELDLDRIALRFNWNEYTQEVEYYFVSSENIDLEYEGAKFTIKKGEKYFIVRSRKFSTFQLEKIFSQHNLDLLKTYKDANNRMVVFSFIKKC